MPVPSCVRPRGALDAVEALEEARQLARRGCRCRCRAPCSIDAPSVGGAAGRRVISPSKRELEGVGEQVEDDLLPHVAIDVDRLGSGGQSTSSARPARSMAERKIAREVGGEAPRGRSARRCACTRPASMREKSSRVLTSLQQPQAVAVDDVELLARRAGQPARSASAASSSGPEHQRQRRAELVADVGEERRSWRGRARPAPRPAAAPPRRRARWRGRRRSGRRAAR